MLPHPTTSITLRITIVAQRNVSAEEELSGIDISKNYCFNLGNVIKYIWRAGLKDGASILLDLKKAKWYLDSKIKDLEKNENKK